VAEAKSSLFRQCPGHGAIDHAALILVRVPPENFIMSDRWNGKDVR